MMRPEVQVPQVHHMGSDQRKRWSSVGSRAAQQAAYRLPETQVPGRPGTPPLTSRNAGRLQVEGRSGRPCTGRRSLPWLPPLVMRHAADALHPLRTCGTSARRAAGRPAALRQRRWVVGAWVPGVVVVGAVALGAVVLGT